MSKNREQGFIRHIAYVIDESASIDQFGLTGTIIDVMDAQIAHLLERNENAESENRVTIYTFNAPGLNLPRGHADGNIRCQFYDRGNLRGLTLKDRYSPAGGTPLIDATFTAIDELKQTAQIHGEHRFLVYAVTDGYNNSSKRTSRELAREIASLDDNWTVACFVPNQQGIEEAIDHGFPAGNIERWSTTVEGVEEVGATMAATTDAWMTGHTVGVRGSKSLFVGGQVDAAAIKAARLSPLDTSDYAIVPVTPVAGLVQEKPEGKKPAPGKPDNRPMVAYMEIEPFIQRVHPPFRVGMTYYELVKTEKIRGNKHLAILDKKTSKVYLGAGVRQMLGLPEEDRTVKPDFNPDYKIYVQSTSLNRHLYLHSSVLILTK